MRHRMYSEDEGKGDYAPPGVIVSGRHCLSPRGILLVVRTLV